MQSLLQTARYAALLIPLFGLFTSLELGCDIHQSDDIGTRSNALSHKYGPGYGYSSGGYYGDEGGYNCGYGYDCGDNDGYGYGDHDDCGYGHKCP